MIVYFAGSWSRREELRKLRDQLQKAIPGLVVNSRWLDLEPTTSASDLRHHPVADGKLKLLRRSRANMDRDDVHASDILVRFTDDLSKSTVPAYLATGSRMVEQGMALERGEPVIVVGGTQPIFDYLEEVTHVKDNAALKRTLRRMVRVEKKADKDSKKILARVVDKIYKKHAQVTAKINRLYREIGD